MVCATVMRCKGIVAAAGSSQIWCGVRVIAAAVLLLLLVLVL